MPSHVFDADPIRQVDEASQGLKLVLALGDPLQIVTGGNPGKVRLCHLEHSDFPAKDVGAGDVLIDFRNVLDDLTSEFVLHVLS